MVQSQSASLCERISLDLVARPSVTGSPDEASFGPWLADYLSDLHCFGPSPQIWTDPVAPEDGRLVINMLMRGTGARTVVLTGHYDTVTIQDYAALKHLACSPYALREALLTQLHGNTDSRAKRAYDDLQSGRFLPGRGLLDMKGGLAAGLAAMAEIASAGSFAGNILFIAVPDEENSSVGARAAAAKLSEIANKNGLEIVAAINLDAIADNGSGKAGQVLALGTVGKVLPTAFVVGRPVHSGYALRGVNAAVLAAFIAARLEWAPELTDDSAGVPGTAASLLSMKDNKSGYDVTTPNTVFLFWNVLNHQRDPATVLDVVERLVNEATTSCLQDLARRAAASGYSTDAKGMPATAQILRYSELLHSVHLRDPSITAALQNLSDATSDLDLPERCRQMTALVWERSGLTGPAVILGLGSIPYLATMLEDTGITRVIETFLSETRLRHGVDIGSEIYFAGISDMSFFGQADDTKFTSLAADTPVWNAAVRLAPGALAQVPTINLGPWGRDYHTPLERTHVDYGFRILPALIVDLTSRILADHSHT